MIGFVITGISLGVAIQNQLKITSKVVKDIPGPPGPRGPRGLPGPQGWQGNAAVTDFEKAWIVDRIRIFDWEVSQLIADWKNVPNNSQMTILTDRIRKLNTKITEIYRVWNEYAKHKIKEYTELQRKIQRI